MAPFQRSSLFLLLVALMWVASTADAAELLPKPGPGDPLRKVSAALLPYLGDQGHDRVVGQALRRQSVAGSQPDQLIVRLDVPVTEANLAAIRNTGAQVVESAARWNTVTVEATLAQIEALARLAAVDQVALPPRPRHRAQPGTYVSEGDDILHTDDLRTAYGETGTGQTIGVISDSVNYTAAVGAGTHTGSTIPYTLTNTIPQVAGDLPASIAVVSFGEQAYATDEGAAMLEEVHHLAPGAALAFAGAGSVSTDMATRIGQLATLAHCNVICDDVIFYDEPMFQDGPIAQAAQEFVDDGGIYLSSAGNEGDMGCLATYDDVNPITADPHTSPATIPPTGDDFHDWGIASATPGFLPLDVPAGGTITIVLQWNQPYHSYDLGAGSQVDLDLLLFSATSSVEDNILTAGGDAQGSTGDPEGNPFEYLEWTNEESSSQRVYLAVSHFSGTANVVFRVVVSSDTSVTAPDSATVFGFGTCYGHAAAAGVLAIGAVPWQTPTEVEPFSSKGGWDAAGLPFYFDTTGAALAGAPQRRNKPNFVAPDGVTTSNDDFSPFYGTSAAGPNAAAAVALVWAVRPQLTNAEVIDALENTAVDITVAPASAGDDAWSGHGLISAYAASGNAVTTITTTVADGLYQTGSIPILIGFNQAVTVTGSPVLQLNTTPARTASYVSGSGTTELTFAYTIQVGDYSAALDVASGAALELNGGTITTPDLAVPIAGNVRSLSGDATLMVDANSPSLIITAAHTTTHDPDITFTFTFNHPVTGFVVGDVAISNGTAGAFAGSGTTYTLEVSAATFGTVTVNVPDAAATDAGGFLSTEANGQVSYTREHVANEAGAGCGGMAGLVIIGLAMASLALRRRWRAPD